MKNFAYEEAFSRNFGWVTKREQLILRDKNVAIAGMGGVGGFHLLTLCRLGIQNFHISDPDQFELVNFNRQAGATITSLKKSKCQTLLEMAKDINPKVQIKTFEAINQENVQEFLSGCDLYVDGMDFFCVDTREALFKACEQLKIPAITAAPIGMGVNYLIFDTNSMSFLDYFQWDKKTEQQKLIQFIVGLAPKPTHLSYLVDKSTVSFFDKKGPSTVMSCMLCAGVAGVQALKILLNREKIYSAPYYHQFDPYKGKYHRGYIVGGNKNPIQKLKIGIISKLLAGIKPKSSENISEENMTIIKKIIKLARWAPSGDNTQPWRFKIISEDTFIILVIPSLENDFYDFESRPTLISVGCLVESILLAANKYNKSASWKMINDPGAQVAIEVNLSSMKRTDDVQQLADFIEYRSVDRCKYQKKAVSNQAMKELQAILDEGYQFNSITEKNKIKEIIKMNMLATQIRLVLKQAHETHQHMIQWDESKSDFGIPYTITGLSKMTTRLMKLIFNHWNVLYFMNYYMGGALLASVELDYIPGKNSAGYFSINAAKSIDKMTEEELIQSGRQIQRVWLYLTKLNLSVQPCYTPIILNHYLRNNKPITDSNKINSKLKRLNRKFEAEGFNENTIFIARLGYAITTDRSVRSTRLDMDTLIYSDVSSE